MLLNWFEFSFILFEFLKNLDAVIKLIIKKSKEFEKIFYVKAR